MKPFTIVAIVVFTLVALAQLLRVALGWEVTVNGIFIPFWVSVIACVIGATLAVMLWREKRK
jgi:ABC-type spermidine/putrescine transport system permease subunit II